MSQNITQILKNYYSFNHSKRRKMTLYYSKKLSALLKGIISKHHGNCYCLNCLDSFSTENKRKSHKKVYVIKHFCNFVIPSEYT